MYPTPEEFCDILDNMLTNNSLDNPTKINMYKTYGYFAETPLSPFKIIRRISRYSGKKLCVNIMVSEKGHCVAWRKKNPTGYKILKAIKSLQHGTQESFIVLLKDGRNYIRTNIACLEYQEGSADEHYFSPPEHISLNNIKNAFLSYAQGCSWWKEQIYWRKGYTP